MLKFGAGFVTGFAALFILMLLFGDYGDKTPAPTNTPAEAQAQPTVTFIPVETTTPVPTPTPLPTLTPAPTASPVPAPAARIGADVAVGKIRWHVNSSQDLGNTLHSDNEFIKDSTTAGRFIQVAFMIEVLANIPASYFSPDLYDNQGRKYSTFSNQYEYLPDNATCALLVLNPNLPTTCMEIFEVPADSSGYKLKATDFSLIFPNEAMIELQ